MPQHHVVQGRYTLRWPVQALCKVFDRDLVVTRSRLNILQSAFVHVLFPPSYTGLLSNRLQVEKYSVFLLVPNERIVRCCYCLILPYFVSLNIYISKTKFFPQKTLHHFYGVTAVA